MITNLHSALDYRRSPAGRGRARQPARPLAVAAEVTAAVAAAALLGMPTPGLAMPIFVNDDPNGNNCLSADNATVYRVNPGPTNLPGMTGSGPLTAAAFRENANGTYGLLSGCATRGAGQAYTGIGSFVNAGPSDVSSTTAVGFLATASVSFTTALGAEATATGLAGMALGTGSLAMGRNTVAIGGGGASVLAVADSTTASGEGAIAIGVNDVRGAQAAATDSIALGGQASVASAATSGLAVGRGASVPGAFGIAMGDGITSGATGQNVAIGSEGTTANALDAGGGAVAIGRGQKATGNGAVAMGDPNVANGNGAVALGANNTAAGDAGGTAAADGAVAIGNVNNAVGPGSLAIGANNKANGAGATALGSGANASLENAIAIGTGAVAGQAGAVALGAGSTTAAAVGTAGTTIGGINRTFAGAAPTSTVSVGAPGAERTLTNVAAGRVGDTSTDAVNGSQLAATNEALTTIGTVGPELTDRWITGTPTTYVAPVSSGPNGTASGSGSVSSGANSVAVGTGATAATGNSVALGNNATTTATVATPGMTLRGNTYAYAGGAPAGTVSVGSAGSERQIQNLAAGQLSATSTDAVNGSQLYAINQAITDVVVVANFGINVTTAATGNGVATGTSVANIGPGAIATYTAGNNMVLTQSGTNMAFALSPTPVFSSVSIFGGPTLSNRGIDMGGKSISNVAPGVGSNDAVTLYQFNAAIAASIGRAQAAIEDANAKAFAGIASAMAVESAPYVPGKVTMTAGAGYYNGYGGAAFSARRTSGDGRWSVTGAVAPSSGGVAGRVGFTAVLE